MKKALIMATLAASLLAACGGGRDHTPEPSAQDPQVVPTSALADAKAYTLYVAGVAAKKDSVALWMDGVNAPVSETDTPVPVE